MKKQDFPVSSGEIRREIAQGIRLHRQSIRLGVRSAKDGITAIWALKILGHALGVSSLSSTRQMFLGNYKGGTE